VDREDALAVAREHGGVVATFPKQAGEEEQTAILVLGVEHGFVEWRVMSPVDAYEWKLWLRPEDFRELIRGFLDAHTERP
jgi:hypothetical protein